LTIPNKKGPSRKILIIFPDKGLGKSARDNDFRVFLRKFDHTSRDQKMVPEVGLEPT
jgi:hypothetical protein